MSQEKKTLVQAGENLSGNLQFYVLYAKFDISATNDYNDRSQKILQTVINLIHVRAQTVILGDPYETTDLEKEGALDLTGEGFVMKFTSEHAEVFGIHDDNGIVTDPVFYLKHFFTEVYFDDNLTFSSIGPSQNIEFRRFESI